MRLIALDFDGTLADSKHSIMYAVKLACQDMGIVPPKLSEVMQLTGLKLEDAVAHFQPNVTMAVKQAWMEKFVYYMDVHKDKNMPPEVLFDNVIPTLDILNDDDTFLAIITGKGRAGLNLSLQTHNLGTYFVVIKTADDGMGKPHPQILFDTMEQLGVHPWETVMVGDTSFDILMGKNAGTKTIGVSYGNHTVPQLQNAGADIIIDSFDALPQAVNQLL